MSIHLACLFSGHKPGAFTGKDDHGRCVQEFICSRCGAVIPKELGVPHKFPDWNFMEYKCNADPTIHVLYQREKRKCTTCSFVEFREVMLPLDTLTPDVGIYPQRDGCSHLIVCPKCGKNFYRKISEHDFGDATYKVHNPDSCNPILTCRVCGYIQFIGEPVPHEFQSKRHNDPSIPCLEQITTCQHCGLSRFEHNHSFQDIETKLVKEVDSRDYHGGWVYWYDVTRQCSVCGLTIQVEAMSEPDVRELAYPPYNPTT